MADDKVVSIAHRVVEAANNDTAVAIFRYFTGFAATVLLALSGWTLSTVQRVEVGLVEQVVLNRTQEQRLETIDRAVSIVNTRIDQTRTDLSTAVLDRYRAIDAERDLRLRDQRLNEHDRRLDALERRP